MPRATANAAAFKSAAALFQFSNHGAPLTVQQHFRVMLNTLRPEYLRERVAELRSAAAEVEAFRQCIVLDPVRLKSYVEALNVQPPATVWWFTVAYQPLEDMWKSRS